MAVLGAGLRPRGNVAKALCDIDLFIIQEGVIAAAAALKYFLFLLGCVLPRPLPSLYSEPPFKRHWRK